MEITAEQFILWLGFACGGGCTTDHASEAGAPQGLMDAVVADGRCRYVDLHGTPHIELVKM